MVDEEFVSLLDSLRKEMPHIPFIIDSDTDKADALNGGDFDRAVLEGLEIDKQLGSRGWDGLVTKVQDENSTISLAYTSGTTARPKGVEYTHRGIYLAALANVIESVLNIESSGERAKYLWTLPMFHVRAFSSMSTLSNHLGEWLDVSLEYH